MWAVLREERVARYVRTVLNSIAATVAIHAVAVGVLTIIVFFTLPWFIQTGGGSGHMSFDLSPLVEPFVAFLIAVPVTAVLVPGLAFWIALLRSGNAIVAAAESMSSVLIILLGFWTATVGWKWPEKDVTLAVSQRIAQEHYRIAVEQRKAAEVKESNRDPDGSRLIEACTYGVRLVRMQLEHGSPVNAHGRRGLTPLIAAVAALPASGAPPAPANLDERVKIIETLLKAGADVNARDNDGFTALDYAVYRGLDQIAEQLRAGGGRSGKSL